MPSGGKDVTLSIGDDSMNPSLEDDDNASKIIMFVEENDGNDDGGSDYNDSIEVLIGTRGMGRESKPRLGSGPGSWARASGWVLGF